MQFLSKNTVLPFRAWVEVSLASAASRSACTCLRAAGCGFRLSAALNSRRGISGCFAQAFVCNTFHSDSDSHCNNQNSQELESMNPTNQLQKYPSLPPLTVILRTQRAGDWGCVLSKYCATVIIMIIITAVSTIIVLITTP